VPVIPADPGLDPGESRNPVTKPVRAFPAGRIKAARLLRLDPARGAVGWANAPAPVSI
jgi:hypothetical protein